ncbi:MAG: hypothetical protein FGM61_01290 [Sediminibacterium sp.]|nr:hypothetical protein [Sediminibacterium sp.]
MISIFYTSFIKYLLVLGNLIHPSITDTFSLRGTYFTSEHEFPKLYTCDSAGISPALQWKNTPIGTKSLAITMHHIAKDGTKHVYFVLYNIPPQTISIPDGVSNLGKFGHNSMNPFAAYAPPCSKGPGQKQYIITIYAIADMKNENDPKIISLPELESWMENKIIHQASLPVNYTRNIK